MEMFSIVVARVVSWFEKNSKVPLSTEAKTLQHEKFQQLGLDLELLQLAQDNDLRELCPQKFLLAKKWQLRWALKDTIFFIHIAISILNLFATNCIDLLVT